MNRRLLIFLIVFVVACAAGLGYTFSIAPTYVATAKIQIDPALGAERTHEAAAFVANEAQALTSNEMLDQVAAAVAATHSASVGIASVASLREMLAAIPAPGSNVVELQARGSQPEQLALLLNAWATGYLASRSDRRDVDRDAAIAEASTAVESLGARVAQKRRQLDEFRRRNNIVSSEREENQVASEVRGLNAAVNDARRKALDAESRLSGLKDSVAEGKPVFRPQDRSNLAQLESQVLDLRQQLAALERSYTPQYLAIEPRAKGMRVNLQQLEQKIEEVRRLSQQEALNEAAQEAATAQKTMIRVEAETKERSKDALTFTSRFSEHKALATELAQVEATLGQAQQRHASLELSERAREPKYQLLGRPTIPEKPVHPNYLLYAAYSVGGALAAALFAVLLLEFLNPRPRPEPAPYPQPIFQIAYPALDGRMNAAPARLSGGVTAALPASYRGLPEALPAPQRELTVAEVWALWEAATSEGRLAVAALFSGLTLEELAELEWDCVDLHARTVKVSPSTSTSRPLLNPLVDELQTKAGVARHTNLVATTNAGVPLGLADLIGLVAAAAHDAGIEEAETIGPETLRHTYVSYLVRQGVRLSELQRILGAIPPASFLYYRTLSPSGPGVPLTQVNCVFPVFQLTS